MTQAGCSLLIVATRAVTNATPTLGSLDGHPHVSTTTVGSPIIGNQNVI